MVDFLAHIIKEPTNIWVIGLCFLIPPVILFLSRRNLNSPIVQFIPGLCTAIGIMFTFGIIYQTLGINDDLFKNNEIASLKQVVNTLSLKFSCSLIGVLSSVFWSIVIKGIISFLESRAQKRNEWLKRDPQELLWSLDQNFMEMIKEYKYNTDFISRAIYDSSDHTKEVLNRILKLLEGFDQKTGESLKKTFEDLKSALAKNVANVSQKAMEDLQESISDVNKEFLETTQGMNATNQEEFGKMLGTSIDTLSRTLSKLDEIGDNIRMAMEKTQEDAENGTMAVARGFETSSDTIKGSVSDLMDSIQNQFERINKRFEGLDEQLQQTTQDILNNNLEKLEKAFDVLSEIQTNSINRLDESTKQFNAAIHTYESLQDHQYRVLERVQHQIVLLNKLQEKADNLLEHWDGQEDRMVEVRNRVADIANTIHELQNIKDSLATIAPRN
jgi:predicted transcriptional regulator